MNGPGRGCCRCRPACPNKLVARVGTIESTLRTVESGRWSKKSACIAMKPYQQWWSSMLTSHQLSKKLQVLAFTICGPFLANITVAPTTDSTYELSSEIGLFHAVVLAVVLGLELWILLSYSQFQLTSFGYKLSFFSILVFAWQKGLKSQSKSKSHYLVCKTYILLVRFKEGEGVSEKSTLCTLVKMEIIMDDPLSSCVCNYA